MVYGNAPYFNVYYSEIKKITKEHSSQNVLPLICVIVK